MDDIGASAIISIIAASDTVRQILFFELSPSSLCFPRYARRKVAGINPAGFVTRPGS